MHGLSHESWRPNKRLYSQCNWFTQGFPIVQVSLLHKALKCHACGTKPSTQNETIQWPFPWKTNCKLHVRHWNSNSVCKYCTVPLCQHEARQHCFLPILTMEMKVTCTKSESSIVLSMEGTYTLHGHVYMYMYIIYSTTLIFQTLVHVSKYLNYPNTLPQFLHTHCKSVS